MELRNPPPWSRPAAAVFEALGTRAHGLTAAEAAARRVPPPKRSRVRVGRILVAQFLDPLVLLLLLAAAVSFPLGSHTDGVLILAIVAMSGGLGFAVEYSAADAVARLLEQVRPTAVVRRDGVTTTVPVADVVPGDVVVLAAGASVPGDGRVVACNALLVDESALTGESFPAEKQVEPVPADVPPARRAAAVFHGSHVVSGTGEVVIAAVGMETELGRIRGHLDRARPPTEFERGLQRFGALLVRVSAALVSVLFAVNVALHRSVPESFLFAVALAVGLVPELLPAIVTVNLSYGARRMGARGVLVKRLAAIEDLGSVDVLCSDKTGTLTEGTVRLREAYGPDGRPSERVRELGWLNATFEQGYTNPIDRALREAHPGDASAYVRRGEVPYDFVRRRLTVVVERDGRWLAVTKGQLDAVLAICAPFDRAPVDALHERLAHDGLRTLGVAWREVPPDTPVHAALEQGFTFAGTLAFVDPPRGDVREVLDRLGALGISLVVITGDDHRVAAAVWRTLHGGEPRVVTGAELATLAPEALEHRVGRVDVFAEVGPIDKERVVTALRRAGRVVAYLGDGINDAPALRAADVGMTVDGAADVAREAADVVLSRPDLQVIADGVREGRRTLANSLKYVHYTTSANFGNMLSMAAASAFLPFLPLLPKQILLNNLLSDLPALAIATDRVDPEHLAVPRRWRTPEIRSFMFLFGAISSVFDLTTFAALYHLTRGDPSGFRTGWFLESLLTEVLVLFVLRSARPLGWSWPSRWLLGTTAAVVAAVWALPFTPVGRAFDLAPPSPAVAAAVAAITALYLATTEGAKRWFFHRR